MRFQHGLSHWRMDSVCEKCLEYAVWMSDFITERIRSWALTQIFSCLCGCLTSSAASLPFHPKWRKIKVCGAYNKITSIFFDNFPCTLAKMVLLIMTFSFSYARWICPAELVCSNLVTVDSTVLCPFHLLRE